MDNILEYIGIISSSTLIAFALIKYFSRQLFENYLIKSIETHKSELEKINISHQIQFAALHKERAVVIKELYDRLHEYKMAVIHFFNVPLSTSAPNRDLELRMHKWSEAVPDFSDYFHRNRIYFSGELCDLIDKLNNELDKINSDTRNFLQSFELLDDQIIAINKPDPKFTELQNNTNEFLEKDIGVISAKLEFEFRKILGVES